MIAALTAAASNDVADRENIDPLAGDKSLNAKRVILESDDSESSFETVIHYNSNPNAFWSQSTPATSGRAKKNPGKRKSTKRKSSNATAATGLYPQLSVYPDMSEGSGNVPVTSTEEFEKIAEGILEEMNTRVEGIYNPQDILVCLQSETTSKRSSWLTACSTNLQGHHCSTQRISFHHQPQLETTFQRCSQ